MKKIVSLLLVAVLAAFSIFAFASCAPKEKLTCGVTIFPGMNEQDENGNWIGFESEFAMAVAEKLGMEAEFQIIEWSQKYNEVNSGAIDCIWNGFTANSYDDGQKRSDLVDFSYGYMLNQQCVVVKAENEAQYTSEASLAGKSACAEAGSAGESYAQSVNASEVIGATAQIDAFREVDSGAVDFIVVDVVLAKNMLESEGSQYTGLSIVDAIELESEIYAIGFKKGSELTAKVNAAIKELEEDGTLETLAKKYGFENVLQITENIEY